MLRWLKKVVEIVFIAILIFAFTAMILSLVGEWSAVAGAINLALGGTFLGSFLGVTSGGLLFGLISSNVILDFVVAGVSYALAHAISPSIAKADLSNVESGINKFGGALGDLGGSVISGTANGIIKSVGTGITGTFHDFTHDDGIMPFLLIGGFLLYYVHNK